MLRKTIRGKLKIRPKLLNIKWYPNSNSCVNTNGHHVSVRQMPPLMVRKAEWRS